MTDYANRTMPPDKIMPRECIAAYEKRGTAVDFSVNAAQETIVSLPLTFYPGCYTATDEEGTILPVAEGERHIMTVVVPPGQHDVKVRFAAKLLWQTAEFVSMVALLFFLRCLRV